MRAIIAFLRLFTFVVWALLVMPAQILWLAFDKGEGAYTIPIFWHGVACRFLGIRKIIEGAPVLDAQTIFISNHLSYLDIPLMGSVLRASFIAKSEVAGWPLFGTLARLQRTVFVSRSRTSLSKEKDNLSRRLHEGTNLIIFAEGTSSDGRHVLPFKSSLLSPVLAHEKAAEMMIQPVSLVIESVDGRAPDDNRARDLYAWHGDMTMPPHLWNFCASRGAVIKIVFHPALKASEWTDRKALAAACHNAVAGPVEQKLLAA